MNSDELDENAVEHDSKERKYRHIDKGVILYYNDFNISYLNNIFSIKL